MKEYSIIKFKDGKKIKVDNHLYVLLNEHSWYECNGYARALVNSKREYMHRLVVDAKKVEEVDHINGDKLDNRILNLRIATRSQNNMNRENTAGVWFSKQKQKWIAEITINRKKIHLGLFKEKKDAIAVRINAEKVYFGEYANSKRKKKKVGLTFGVFDLCHQGHIRLLQNAKKYVDTLIVCVSTDEFATKTKGKKPFTKVRQRRAMVNELDIVATTDEQSSRFGKKEAIKKYCPDLLFVGSDHKNDYSGEGYGVPVIYLPHTKDISSTMLRRDL